jgi:crotonobetaine/carnitine-CoA ligase
MMPESVERTLVTVVAERAEHWPDRVIFNCEDGDLTYGRLWSNGVRLSNALRDRGIATGQTVGVLTELGVATLETWIGLAVAGIVEVPLNPALKGDSLAYQLKHARCAALIVSASLLDRLPVLSELPDIGLVVVIDGNESTDGTVHYADLLAEGDEVARPAEVASGDIAVICFTSGTTGPPKGAELSHRANIKLAEDVVTGMQYTADDVLLSMFPFSHINARYTSALAAMLANARVVFRRGFSASAFWDLCRAEGITAFNYLGGLPSFLLNQPERPNDSEHSVRRAYGAGTSSDALTAFERRFGVPLIEVLGSTEMGTICANTMSERRLGSCGKPVPALEVALLDERGWPVPPGEAGEVVIRPRQPDVIMREYHRAPEATLQAFRNLWFHTGDRCRTDEDGWFYFVDRIKDSIRRRGENISSWEIEQAAVSHPDIAEAAAVGVRFGDEEEVLLVVVAGENPPTPEELLTHCQAKLPYFAVPRFVRFATELPRNSSARVVKADIRTQGISEGTWDRTEAGYQVTR